MYAIIILLFYNFYCTNGWIHPLKSYCELGCAHDYVNTMCKLADVDCQPTIPTCMPSSISKEYRQILLDAHNYYRNYLASGQEKLVGFTVPNMMYIRYDDELAEIAQCHANECTDHGFPNTHDKCRRAHKFESVGQNIQHYYYSLLNVKMFQEKEFAWKNLYDGFYMEVRFVDPSNYGVNKYNQTRLPGVDPKTNIGHYAQMVNAVSDYMGCGWSTNERVVDEDKVPHHKKFHYLLVCNYAQGARLLSTLIKPGEPCSECPPGRPCIKDSKYPALCGMEEDPPDDVEPSEETNGTANIAINRLIHLLIICYTIIS